MGGIDRTADLDSPLIKRIGAGDGDETRSQDEGQKHGNSQVEVLEAEMLPSPAARQQGVGEEEGHVDADGGAELAEHKGDSFLGTGDVKPEQPAQQGFEVDPRLDDDQEESADHEQEHVLKDPLEGPQGPPAAAAVAP